MLLSLVAVFRELEDGPENPKRARARGLLGLRVMSSNPGHEPVTAVFNRRVKDGHEEDYKAVVERAAVASKLFPGHLASTVLHTDGTRDYQVIYTFTDPHAMHDWLASDERRALMRELDGVSESLDKVEPLTGLGPGSCCRTAAR